MKSVKIQQILPGRLGLGPPKNGVFRGRPSSFLVWQSLGSAILIGYFSVFLGGHAGPQKKQFSSRKKKGGSRDPLANPILLLSVCVIAKANRYDGAVRSGTMGLGAIFEAFWAAEKETARQFNCGALTDSYCIVTLSYCHITHCITLSILNMEKSFGTMH